MPETSRQIDIDSHVPSSPTASKSEGYTSEREEAIDLFFAISDGSFEKAKELLVAGVDANFKDFQQRCPLHIAAGIGDRQMIELLLEHKADLNAMDKWGQTPLDQSQLGRHTKAVQLLKNNGAKLSVDSLRMKSVGERWAVKRSEVLLQEQLMCTLKSKVHRATWNGVEVVAKFALRDETDNAQEVEEELLHEINLLTSLRHPDLVLFLGCCLMESPCMFISEYMSGGDLEHYYKAKRAAGNGKPWAPNKNIVYRWSLHILRALSFLHNCAQQVIHRDLKPLNILLTKNHDVKVSDFGISKVTDMRRPSISTPVTSPMNKQVSELSFGGPSPRFQKQMTPYVMTGGVGSHRYMAPEVARHDLYTEKVDIFSFAFVLYFLSCGRQPLYAYQDPVAILNEYCEGREPRPRTSECPSCFSKVMEAGWASLPEDRPSAAELAELLVDTPVTGGSSCRPPCLQS